MKRPKIIPLEPVTQHKVTLPTQLLSAATLGRFAAVEKAPSCCQVPLPIAPCQNPVPPRRLLTFCSSGASKLPQGTADAAMLQAY